MLRRFTQRAQRAIIHAQEEARNLGHPAVGTEHILLGLIREGEGVGAKAILALGVDLETVRNELKKVLGDVGERKESATSTDLPITPRAKKVLNLAFEEARLQGVNYVGTEHLLLALLREEQSVAAQVLNSLGIRPDAVREQVMLLLGAEGFQANYQEPGTGEMKNQSQGPGVAGRRGRGRGKTPVLDTFSRDLTQLAREHKLDPVIGREKEIDRVTQVLSRRTKNNPVLIGDPGVGKTAIVEGLAQRIVENKVPEVLSDKRVVVLDLSTMVAGTKYRGEFEDRLTKVVNEIRNAGDIIVFIDELHTIVGAGAAEGAIDAANILKPALARGEFQCIGATTIDEYRKHVEKDAALERRFQPIMVDEPTVEETIEILRGLRDRYEAHHGVKITDEAIEAAARLSARYITDRFLPDKAIDLIDEAASKVRLRNYVLPDELKEMEARLEEIEKEKEEAIMAQEYEKAAGLRDEEQRVKEEIEKQRKEWMSRRDRDSGVVTPDEIAHVVSSWTGIPVVQMAEEESERLVKLEEILHQRVIGQDEAVKAVAQAVRRARAGLKDPKRPIGSFIFLGPTGVGKTELARALAEALFGSEEALIRLDMSEYMEKHAVARMIGSPPGYVGYDEGGQLTEKVRRKPYSVILLDEIEKAHPDVYNILLQVLEDGRLTDGKGRTVDFRNTVVIMTSNVGADTIRKARNLGFGRQDADEQDHEKMKEKIMEKLKATFRPEFLNRIDEVIVFHSLNDTELGQIFELLIRDLRKRLEDQGFRLQVTDDAKKFIIKQGHDPVFGARPLKRAIQKNVENLLSEEILKRTVEPGDTILIDVENDEIKVRKA
ncbi:MAG TPA: ATP-dependent Clp protease ATP-binding subunit [Syntrophothermus lipocalidus]|uniref:ATPase AAA-2 domain protein n=1 Tax=Syntrophothermus lipocalidus (strain DSM 12680 / TGB-C1) TaxID=643648 RepID=D7CJQ4_SYNLT|nr:MULTISPECIES: ATP-dependent Clp protease ATP-binding subunit [Syntrophothermus]ADI03009.1 ATPase AAA-2 domain protein [Syntrophothermus lipocalidus DSM 12680]NSW82047.1 ATP-dependent Clp protease ATP-binding subunit [Syntrophothermus sp.]HHV76299.1 ATP-dependent Clp protease ATP-binding subunit [Syntrophothermus lipocalidus]